MVSHSFQLLLWLPPLSLKFSREMSLFTSHLLLNHPMWLCLSEFHLQEPSFLNSYHLLALTMTSHFLKCSLPSASLGQCSPGVPLTPLALLWVISESVFSHQKLLMFSESGYRSHLRSLKFFSLHILINAMVSFNSYLQVFLYSYPDPSFLCFIFVIYNSSWKAESPYQPVCREWNQDLANNPLVPFSITQGSSPVLWVSV